MTLSGEPVCPFTDPPGKQPFEHLIFGVRPDEINLFPRPEDGRIFISVPSAVHSHKPPISGNFQALPTYSSKLSVVYLCFILFCRDDAKLSPQQPSLLGNICPLPPSKLDQLGT